MPDKDGYPTDEELEIIKTWSIKGLDDFHNLMKYIYELWNYSELAWSQKGNVYQISTMGWSGNEDLIGAMRENMMFWIFYWAQSTRGGHYIFCPIGNEFDGIPDVTIYS
jgi:hypothetical protein